MPINIVFETLADLSNGSPLAADDLLLIYRNNQSYSIYGSDINPMTTLGDMITGGNSGVPTQLSGNASVTPMYLKSLGNGSLANSQAWAQILLSDTSGTLGATRGGTGLTAFTQYDMLYASATNTLARLATVNSAVMGTTSGGLPGWITTLPAINSAATTLENPTTSSNDNLQNIVNDIYANASEATDLAGGILGSSPYQSAPGNTQFVTPNTTTALQVYTMTGTGTVGAEPVWYPTATANTASTIMVRGSNSNVAINEIIQNQATTATAAGTTPLTVASAPIQIFTGTTTQTVSLEATNTLLLYHYYEIVNQSTGNVTVNNSAASLVSTVLPGTTAFVYATNSASPGTWGVIIFVNPSGNVATATTAVNLSGMQAANNFYAAPNGSSGAGGWRSIVVADIPTLNQNTTGSSGSCTGNSATASIATQVSTTTQSGATNYYLALLGANSTSSQGIVVCTPYVTANTGILNASGFAGALTGNVTGNVSGSSGSCTGNSTTATNATTSTNIAGGVLGTTFYQSVANTTATVAPYTTANQGVYAMTGTGTTGAQPVWTNAPTLSSINFSAASTSAVGVAEIATSTDWYANAINSTKILPPSAIPFTNYYATGTTPAWTATNEYILAVTQDPFASGFFGNGFLTVNMWASSTVNMSFTLAWTFNQTQRAVFTVSNYSVGAGLTSTWSLAQFLTQMTFSVYRDTTNQGCVITFTPSVNLMAVDSDIVITSTQSLFAKNTTFIGQLKSTLTDTLINGQSALPTTSQSISATFTPTLVGWTNVGTPTVTGNYTQNGNSVTIAIKIIPATTISSTLLTSTITGLPLAIGAMNYTLGVSDLTSGAGLLNATALAATTTINPPAISATADTIIITGTYNIV